MKTAIIGAGAAGLSAAFDLVRAGHEVTVFEASDRAGGLAGGFSCPRWDWTVEKYYHHWFQSDEHLLRLAGELGVRDKVFFPRPVTVLYHEREFYAFDSPAAVLKFPGVPFIDRVRFGAVGAYLKLTRDWKRLEKFTAHQWLSKYLGKRAYETLWEPMLEGKFGRQYYRQVNMAWFWARIHARTRRLGTFEGGFQAFLDILAERIRKDGATVHLNCRVDRIEAGESAGLKVDSGRGEQVFDRVLSTTSPALLQKMVPSLPEDYLESVRGLKSLGAVVAVAALDRQLGPGYYWYNLPKSAGFPFLCLVEHTAFVDCKHFGGDHIVYCGDYVPVDHPYFAMNEEQLREKCEESFRKINPSFDSSWIKDIWVFKAPYAQPVPEVNHSRNIPSIATPLPGLYWASMSHVYPWDRGTNFAVEIGRKAAGMISAGQ
jgi:protoporphyrinogen oxidase